MELLVDMSGKVTKLRYASAGDAAGVARVLGDAWTAANQKTGGTSRRGPNQGRPGRGGADLPAATGSDLPSGSDQMPEVRSG